MRGAGGGRPAKPEGQSVTRHRRKSDDKKTLPADGRNGATPAPLFELTDAGKTLWAQLWARPEATQWCPVGDRAAISRLVLLQTSPEMWRLDKTLLAELRQLEDRFGLNPYARKHLGWELEQAPADGGKAPAAPARRGMTKERKEAALRLINGAGA